MLAQSTLNVAYGCRALGERCCSNTEFDAGGDMCPGSTNNQTLVCSVLEDYETEAEPATCVECGKVGNPCCIDSSSFSDPTCVKGAECSTGMCLACGGYGQPCCRRKDFLPDATETLCPYAGAYYLLDNSSNGFRWQKVCRWILFLTFSDALWGTTWDTCICCYCRIKC